MIARIVLLCEDQQIAAFVRRFLKRRGWLPHQIREKIAPPGEGSGEQWVRERFPNELSAMRSHGGTVLLVGTDADALSVAERIDTLDRACKERRIRTRNLQEPVMMIVPKRNIETWFAWLRGEVVDEERVYPRYRNESDCRNDVRALEGMCASRKLRDPVLPSLSAACSEFERCSRKSGLRRP